MFRDARIPYADEDEIWADCAQLVQLRSADPKVFRDVNVGLELKNEYEIATILEKLEAIVSYRRGSKVLTITAEAIKYICRHPVLPKIIIRSINITCKNTKFLNAIELLYNLTLQNNAVSEMDRKLIRLHFVDPSNYKILMDILYHIDLLDKCRPELDMKLKILKIVHCVSIVKGSQYQTSLVTKNNINSLKVLLTTYETNGDINIYLLGIVKILCRNKQNCPLFCCDNFLNLFLAAVQFTKKYALSVTILNFLSKHGDSVEMMAKSEPLLNFIVNTLLWDKITNKKHLVSTLYKITFDPQYICQSCYWTKLFAYFQQFDKCEDEKLNMLAVKVYTILNRGISNQIIDESPYCIDAQMPETWQKVVSSDDDSDEEVEVEEEINEPGLDGSKNPYCSIESDRGWDDDECDDGHDLMVHQTNPMFKEDLLNELTAFFQEFTSEAANNLVTNMKTFAGLAHIKNIDYRNKKISERTQMYRKINFRAFPDCVPNFDHFHPDFVSSKSNILTIPTLANKLQIAKDIEKNTVTIREVYNLDVLLDNPESNSPDIPSASTLQINGIMREGTECSYKFPNEDSRPDGSKGCLKFESRFECGNLRQAEQLGEYEYNLKLTPDIHLTRGLQWFYFQVTNMTAGQSYIFNIINFVKVDSQFNYGLQPVLFSVNDYVLNSVGWRKSGERIIYYGNEYINVHTQKQLRTLSFTLQFPYNNDCCYIAYHYPYTYSKLMMSVASLLDVNTSIIYGRCDKLCATVNNRNDVPLISITSSRSREKVAAVPFHKRPFVFLTARVHPCESNASWIMDGILNFLMNEQDERAIQARDRFIFKIIPMLNVEGVIYGNSRCGLTGQDLNRCWKRPSQILHPEIFYVKELVRYAKEVLKKPIVAFIDIHGHSRKKFFFLYGCNPILSWNDKDRNEAACRRNAYDLPQAIAATNDSMKLSLCRFNIEKKREATCRIVMWREFGIDRSYTLECSYCSGANKKKMTVAILEEIGQSIIIALMDL